MIYIAYQVSRTQSFLDDSIKKINKEIYPKEISVQLNDLLPQLEQLDQYATQSNFDYQKLNFLFTWRNIVTVLVHVFLLLLLLLLLLLILILLTLSNISNNSKEYIFYF